MRRCLIVAYLTMGGRELRDYLAQLVAQGPLQVHVVVPVPTVEFVDPAASLTLGTTWTPTVTDVANRAQGDLDGLLDRLRRAGIDATGELGGGDPIVAMALAERAGHYEELIVSTLPPGISRWLRMDVPHRARRRFGDRVTTIINHRAQAPMPAGRADVAPEIGGVEAVSRRQPIGVLLVDPRPPGAGDLAVMLERTRVGCVVTRVATTAGALAQLRAESHGGDCARSDVVVIALDPPACGGLDMLAELMAASELGARTVVVASEVDDPGAGGRAHELGASAFITTASQLDQSIEIFNAVLLEFAFLGHVSDPPGTGGTA